MKTNLMGRSSTTDSKRNLERQHLFADARRVVVITGAGISAAAGLATFRGPTGLASTDDMTERLSGRHLEADPEDVRAFVTGMADDAARCEPTAAHFALAEWQRSLRAKGGDLTLVTMNIDGLHERAGAETLELHGSAHRLRCEQCAAMHAGPWTSDPCRSCGGQVRADVVLYGERVMVEPEWKVKRALPDADLFLAIGTSVETGTISSWARFCRRDYDVPTVLFSLDPSPAAAEQFDVVIDGQADEIVEYIATSR